MATRAMARCLRSPGCRRNNGLCATHEPARQRKSAGFFISSETYMKAHRAGLAAALNNWFGVAERRGIDRFSQHYAVSQGPIPATAVPKQTSSKRTYGPLGSSWFNFRLPVIRPQSRIAPCRISGKHYATYTNDDRFALHGVFPGSSTLSFPTGIKHSLLRSCELRALADVQVPATCEAGQVCALREEVKLDAVPGKRRRPVESIGVNERPLWIPG